MGAVLFHRETGAMIIDAIEMLNAIEPVEPVQIDWKIQKKKDRSEIDIGLSAYWALIGKLLYAYRWAGSVISYHAL